MELPICFLVTLAYLKIRSDPVAEIRGRHRPRPVNALYQSIQLFHIELLGAHWTWWLRLRRSGFVRGLSALGQLYRTAHCTVANSFLTNNHTLVAYCSNVRWAQTLMSTTMSESCVRIVLFHISLAPQWLEYGEIPAIASGQESSSNSVRSSSLSSA